MNELAEVLEGKAEMEARLKAAMKEAQDQTAKVYPPESVTKNRL